MRTYTPLFRQSSSQLYVVRFFKICGVKQITQPVGITVLILMFTACTNHTTRMPESAGTHLKNATVFSCSEPINFIGHSIGNGQCVDFVRACSEIPSTQFWRPGHALYSGRNDARPLTPNSLQYGTIIATFEGDRYPNTSGHHAAMYVSHDEDGIWVYDQFRKKSVSLRHIRVRHDRAAPSNTAQAYRVVQVIENASQ